MEKELEIIGANVPEELIPEILVRLPVKSLLKFRCVSKSWLSLISSDQFEKAHLKISTNNNVHTLIFGSSVLNSSHMNLYTCSINTVSSLTDTVYSVEDETSIDNYVRLDCPFTGTRMVDKYIWLVGSCNGLVCLSSCHNGLVLWNPTTRKSKELPYSPTDFDDASSYSCHHAFGYDEAHDDYKVVEFNDISNVEVNVYSRRSNSWKVLTNWPGGRASHWTGQFLNGAIHWSVCDSGRSPKLFVVALDLASDVFVDLPLPKLDDYDDVGVIHVQILQGCLALGCGYSTCTDVWIMKEYEVGESWIKVVCISYFLDLRGTTLNQPFPEFILEDGKILINNGTSVRIYGSSNPQPQQFSSTFF